MKLKKIFAGASLLPVLFFGCSKNTPPEKTDAPTSSISAYENQPKTNVGRRLDKIRPSNADPTTQKIFSEYGAMFIAGGGVQIPDKFIFKNEDEVQSFQTSVPTRAAQIDGIQIELQKPAMDALLEAEREAADKNIHISPRGTLSAKRSYRKTVELWNSRMFPALDCWTNRKKITTADAEELKRKPTFEQITKVLEYERNGWFFGKGCAKSILESAAAPGASQHNFLLALDVVQFSSPQVRAILARHGWFQTVNSDFSHFTYLGVEEKDLPDLGLKSVTIQGQKFWVPNL